MRGNGDPDLEVQIDGGDRGVQIREEEGVRDLAIGGAEDLEEVVAHLPHQVLRHLEADLEIEETIGEDDLHDRMKTKKVLEKYSHWAEYPIPGLG